MAVPTATSSATFGEVEVSPSVFDMRAAPDQRIDNVLTVTNLTAVPLTLRLRPATLESVGGVMRVHEGEETIDTFASWIDVPQDTVSLEPYGSAIVPFAFRVPAKAEAGGYLGAIAVSTRAVEDVEQIRGATLFLTVHGDIEERMRLVTFSTGQTVFGGRDVRFSTTVRNEGGAHVTPRGRISIESIFGTPVVEVPLEREVVLARGEHRFDTSYRFPHIGVYKARLSMEYATKRKPLEGTIWFMANGIETAIIAVLLLAGLVWVLRKLVRRFSSRTTRK
jgi:hypothetical protein